MALKLDNGGLRNPSFKLGNLKPYKGTQTHPRIGENPTKITPNPPQAALAAVTPVDPAGPDCYRGRAKPWESNALLLQGVAHG